MIYAVVSGAERDVCITLRNRGNSGAGRVKLLVLTEPSYDEESLRPGRTISRCFEAPTEISLRCGNNNRDSCRAVWRIDTF